MERLRRARSNYTDYIKAVRSGVGFQWNWHHYTMAEKLNDFAHGRIPRLMIFMPPRHGKSEFGTRLLPGFMHGLNPALQIALISYSADHAEELAVDAQTIMEGAEYQAIFDDVKIPRIGSKGRYRRSNKFMRIPGGGTLRAAGIAGPITGKGFNVMVIDDPLKNDEDAESATIREKQYHWYRSTVYSRLEAIGNWPGQVLIICTRWHHGDLPGKLIADQAKDPKILPWEFVNFPAIKDTERDPMDPRAIGEALWPWRKTAAELAEIKAVMQSYWWPLFQQVPQQESGTTFKRQWFNFYKPREVDVPIPDFYIDAADENKPDSNRTAMVAYARSGQECLIPWAGTILAEFPDRVKWIQQMVAIHGGPGSRVYIEPKSSGKAIAQYLKRHSDLLIIQDEPPTESKTARAKAQSPWLEGGRVWLAEGEAWVEPFLHEVTGFPKLELDDLPDAFTGALRKAFGSVFEFL